MKNKEIAELLQISPATVSLAINNKPGVSEETRRKILELREAGSLERTRGTRAIRAARQKVVEVLVYELSSELLVDADFQMSLFRNLSNRLNQNSYQMSISFIPESDMKEKILEINKSTVDGVIWLATSMPENMAELIRDTMKKPYVVVDAFFKGFNLDTVLMDNFGGIRLAVDYAVRKGHKKIGYIDSTYPMKNFEDRFGEFCASMNRHHLPINEDYIFRTYFLPEEAANDMRRFLKGHFELPTIFITGNDFIAVGAYTALKEAGYRIPEDISIIGFDDISEAKKLEPPLTTLRIRQLEIAYAAADRLIAKIEHPEENDYSIQQLISVDFMERDSVLSL